VDGRQRALVDVRIAVCREGTVLMLQRCDNLFPGYWNLPGGHALPGEDALTAAARELREETGIAAVPAALEFACVSHIRPSGRSEKVSLIRPLSPLMPQAGEALRMIRSGQRFSTYGLDDSNPG
jgi:8-oxo-dGTP pyrophosphatase MutT (NUDIX family)